MMQISYAFLACETEEDREIRQLVTKAENIADAEILGIK